MSLDQLISFDPPPEIDVSQLSAEQANDIILPAQLQARIKRGLEEIYSTSEGRQAIEEAAAASRDGRVHIVYNQDGLTLALGNSISNTIAFGSRDAAGQYLEPSTGEYANFTIQRTLFHELYHMGNGHSTNGEGFNLPQEAEAIEATNRFMQKYYGEPHRSTDYSDVRLGGTPQHDFSRDFMPASP